MRKLVLFSVNHPLLVVSLTLGLTILLGAQLPKIRTDTDPKNMLPSTSDVRVFNREVEKWFALYEDMIVVGIVREGGALDRAALDLVTRLTQQIVGVPGVAAADVTSLTTADNVVSEAGTLSVQPLLPAIPSSEEELSAFHRSMRDNPMVVGRLISGDGRATVSFRGARVS